MGISGRRACAGVEPSQAGRPGSGIRGSPMPPCSSKVANALGIRWYLVGDNDGKRTKEEPRLKGHLDGAEAADRFVFPYPNIEVHLLRNGYETVYSPHMPQQNLRKLTKQPGDPGYWQEYAANLPGRAKTRAAADVAIEMEHRGSAGVTSEIRGVLEKAVSLARGDSS